MPIESRFVNVGEEAPLFSLPRVNGDNFDIRQMRGKQHVVLVFLRGFF